MKKIPLENDTFVGTMHVRVSKRGPREVNLL